MSEPTSFLLIIIDIDIIIIDIIIIDIIIILRS